MTVDAECLADISDLIRKTDFQRMKTVADVLDHLRSLNRRGDNRCINTAVQSANRAVVSSSSAPISVNGGA